MSSAIAMISAVVRHPTLWTTAWRVGRRTARRGWWHRPPFLPLPSGPYRDFRMVTQYGDADAPIVAHDVIAYLQWCRRQHNG